MVDIDQLKQLREETGISFAECKKALEEAQGEYGKALEVLKARGVALAKKKEDRQTGEGIVKAYAHSTGKIGVLVDLRCETDFVARAEHFQSLAHEIALQVAGMDPESMEDLLSQPYVKDSSKTVADLIQEAIATLGENILVKRFVRYQI
ncbi:MAG: translation elongation factor Ts [Candidatus Yanofskybacteria bacterium]|nr:translation elongation factor Ts [Candidatus Yanofskybacteria bacterium]